MLTKYDKFLVSAIGIAATLLYQYNITAPNHWVTIILGVLTAAGVWTVPNKV